MSDPTPSAYDALRAHLREAATISSLSALVGWDQETFMPPRAAAFRAEQLATLSALAHARRADPRLGDLIGACEADAATMADPARAASVARARRDFERVTKLPPDLVRDFAETSSRAMHAWRDAREQSDFAAFASWLARIVELNRARAEAFGVPAGGSAYDPLLDEYEPGMTSARIDETFAALRGGLAPLIREIAATGRRPDTAWETIPVPVERQVAFNRGVLERMGFDLDAGRLDVSTHPFCDGIAPGDTRMTTRYRDDAFSDALSSTLHEGGHGLYEQNLPKDRHFGEPLGEAASTGIHESQSRTWENLVGRSRPFWEWALPTLRASTGIAAFEGVDVETVYRGVNVVEPRLIRIESDEATYNLHIMLRYDLERALLSGDLGVADLPAAWNDRMKADLGLDVPDDRHGCLQDIHWSMGAMGYFPTYTLGNLYAAQFWTRVTADLPALDDHVRAGDFSPLLGWLREHVFAHGRRFTAPELCERITGRPLSHEPLLRYLEGKLRPIYGL